MKSKTLKENKDFRRLYYRGKSQASSCLVTYVQKSRESETRYGITASKKIGSAVERNRAKRVIRAAFEQLEPRIKGSYDFVFVARTRTSNVKMQDVLVQMEEHFKALGVIEE
ncbi:MAG: ribonuclease P protein component [Eubacterium sp.]